MMPEERNYIVCVVPIPGKTMRGANEAVAKKHAIKKEVARKREYLRAEVLVGNI